MLCTNASLNSVAILAIIVCITSYFCVKECACWFMGGSKSIRPLHVHQLDHYMFLVESNTDAVTAQRMLCLLTCELLDIARHSLHACFLHSLFLPRKQRANVFKKLRQTVSLWYLLWNALPVEMQKQVGWSRHSIGWRLHVRFACDRRDANASLQASHLVCHPLLTRSRTWK